MKLSVAKGKVTATTIRQRFVSGFFLYAVVDIIIRLQSFILLPILTKVLGSVNYGIWVQIGTSINMVSSFGNLGIGGAMYRYLPGLPPEQLRRQFWMSIAIVVVTTTLLGSPFFLFAEPIGAAFFGGSENAIFVVLGGVLMMTNVLRSHLLMYFRLMLQMKPFTAFMLVQAVLSTVAYAWAALSGGKLMFIAVTAVVVDVVLCILAVGLVGRWLGFAWPDFGPIRKFLALGLPTMPLGFMNWALNSADRFVVAYYLGTDDLGVYAVAYQLAFLSILIVVTPIWMMAPGSINALWNIGQKEEALALLRQLYKYTYILTVPIACVMVFWGSFLIEKLTTDEFASGSSLIFWVVLAYAFEYTSSFYRVIFSWFENTKIFLLSFPIAVATNLGLNFVLIPEFGLLGVAMATTGAYGLLFVMEVLFSRRYLQPKFPVGQSLLAVGLGTTIAYVISRVSHHNWISFIWQVSLFCGLYLFGCWALKLVTRQDIMIVVKLLRKQ